MNQLLNLLNNSSCPEQNYLPITVAAYLEDLNEVARYICMLKYLTDGHPSEVRI
jgi:hypothetical protein